MKTRLLFFGALGDALGRERDLDLPQGGCSIAALRRRLCAEDEAAAAAMTGRTVLASIDQQIVGDEAMAHPGQEIAFFTPLSGG
ncbi:MAG: MoaD/ThiS family protein [Alphaproteobacteria bacterium]|nr:MoaD/ThiS family protein [Alphaproteobacteria bacterium]